MRIPFGAMLIAGSLGLMLGACETVEETADGGPNPDGFVPGDDGSTHDTAQPPPGLVTFKGVDDVAEVSSEATNEWLIVPYSVSGTASDAIDYSLNVEAITNTSLSTTTVRVARQPIPLAVRNPAFWARWQKRLAVEAWTRSLRERAASSVLSAPATLAKLTPQELGELQWFADEPCTLSSDCAELEVCHALTCQPSFTLNIKEFAPTTQEITVSVKRKGTHVAILVDEGASASEGDLDAMLEAFDTTIYPRATGVFGNPTLKDGEATLASDRNADGLAWIVVTDKVSEKTEAMGFFVATDFTDEANSNKADILYVTDPTDGIDGIVTTMAHEFQHLLNFGTKVYKPQVNGGTGSLEALWLDEGQAHFSEDICGYGGENTTLLDQELFTSFSDTSLITAEDGLTMRAMAMTFVRYLFEQKGAVSYNVDGTVTDGGGAAWLQSLRAHNGTGADSVTATYGDYKAAMDYWIATIALDGRDATDSPLFNYRELITDPITGQQIGLKIRGTRKDATGEDVELEGPLEEDITVGQKEDTVRNASAKFFLLKNQEGTVKVTLSSQDSDMRLAVIKVK